MANDGTDRKLARAHQLFLIASREFQKLDNAVGLNFNHLAAAAPAPSDVLGPRLIAAPQQQEAFVPPCFKFGSRSPLNTEAEQQAMDSNKPSQHDELANAFSSAFNDLSLRNDHPGSSATSDEVEAASSDTGAAQATSDFLEPPPIADPQQQGALVPPCFTFSSGSPPNTEAEQHDDEAEKHDDLADAFSSTFNSKDHPGTSAFNGLSLSNDHRGSSATAVQAASSDTETQTISLDLHSKEEEEVGRKSSEVIIYLQ